ncbi:MAG TPA: hypothetical protein ENI23_17830 [bacterium]|nr:hypothetical protein [bacterium]
MPVDHEMFNDINSTQWMWYFYHFMEDREEEFINGRDLIEYHASFIEPEAVRKIREAREESVEVPHEEFVAGIEYFFGRKIGIGKEKKKGIESFSIDPDIAIRKAGEYKKQQKQKPGKQLDSRHWLDIDLEQTNG